ADLYIMPADKSKPEELLYANDYPKWPYSWSPDGQLLAFSELRPGSALDIWIYSMSDKRFIHFETVHRTRPRRPFLRMAGGWPISPMNWNAMKSRRCISRSRANL